MAKVIQKNRITVFGVDRGLEKASKKFGIKCVHGWSGDVLETLRKQKFCIIYLDYCGTPDGNAFFDPMEDLGRASTMLVRGGVLACTFCKRCPSVLSKCVNMAPPTLRLERAYEYCDTSAMVFVAYSMRKLPRVGPPVGSIVRVEKWNARVEEIYLDGVRLTLVKKTANGWVADNAETKLWEEPFTAISDVVELPKRRKKPKRPTSKTSDMLCFADAFRNAFTANGTNPALKYFKAWFDENITTTGGDTDSYMSKSAALMHIKSWYEAKSIPQEKRLSDRCSIACKQAKCCSSVCKRFLVHMSNALGHVKYKIENGVETRQALKNNEGKYYYRAYFKASKANIIKIQDGLIKSAVYTQ